MRHIYSCIFILGCFLFSTVSLAQYRTLEFIENKGQWDGPHLYQAGTETETVFLQPTSFTYTISDPKNNEYLHEKKHSGLKDGTVFKFHSYKLSFIDANENCEISADKVEKHYYNYFLGKDPKKWQSEIHPSRALDYKGLYPGIDMHLSSENQSLKYEFIVAPHADVKQLKLKYEGQEKLSIKDGNLIITTSVGEVKEMKPYTFQVINGERKQIACKYKISNDNIVTYSFPDGYDETTQLVIDPTIVFATFTGASADNFGFTATYDNAGNFYGGGFVHFFSAASSFPTSVGAFQTTYMGGTTTSGNGYECDIVVFKYNPSGTAYLFATFLGGSDNEQPHSLVVDAANNLIVAGRTYSNNYPVSATGYDQTYNGAGDIVVSKLNSTGTMLLGSTYMGGSAGDGINEDANPVVAGNLKHNYGDDARSEVIVDNLGNVYVAAPTFSSDFPTANAFQSALSGGQDGVVFKLDNNLSNLTWSTFLGGTNNDAAYVLALNKSQSHVYVAGGTMSSNFPYTVGTYQASYQGGTVDGFIGRFQNSGTYPLQRMTSIGTGNYDQCYGLQMDDNNSVYAMGQTLGGSFPVTAGVYSNPSSSQFVIKLDSMLTNNVYSTVFGSGNSTQTNISPVAFLVDTCENVYISGWGGNLNLPYPGMGNNFNMPLSTINLPAQSSTDGQDFYFIVFSKNVQQLLYSTYMGGAGVGEHVDGGTSRFDNTGIVYQAICGGCGGTSNFPVTPGTVSTVNGSANCNLVAVKIAFELGAVLASASANPDTVGCTPFTVNFSNGSTNAVNYEWDFGDNGSSTQATPTHTYTNPGVYTVRMIAINPNACVERDTVYMGITVLANSITPDFTVSKTDSCGPFRANFNNTSQFGTTPGAPSFTKFAWDFGDGTTFNGANPPLHNFPDSGCYNIRLIMTDSTACNSPDTVIKQICFTPSFVVASFIAPDSLCISSGTLFANNSLNAQSTLWDFGDGETSTSTSPIHIYSTSGTYTVTLVASNPATCNKVDSTTRVVTVKALPVAYFVHTPIIPVPNEPISFNNRSQNAVSYVWAFGDGKGCSDVNPKHLYNRTGAYTVCLAARSADGCVDTFCRRVDAEVVPAIGVPSAFSPNGDGNNDVLYVYGAAIESMTFKLFNRWGQLVFETTNIENGWDGVYQGKPQEMDSYGYTLTANFYDGTTQNLQGNVTLLR